MNDMKIEYLVNAAEQRLHRREEVRFAKKERKKLLKGRNFPHWDMSRLEHYTQRMLLRREQRYLHLARAFVKGTDYLRVENSTREGNEPKLDSLMETLEEWGYNPSSFYVEHWMKGQANV